MLIKIKVIGRWDDILNAARFTQSNAENPPPFKTLLTRIKNFILRRPTPPVMSERFFRQALTSRHSIIRPVLLKIDLSPVPYYTHIHFWRHSVALPLPFVRSQRPSCSNPVDYDRRKAPQDAPVELREYVNLEGLLALMEKRLCKTADPETRRLCFEIKDALLASSDPFLVILGQFCQPQCVWRGGRCNEVFNPCGDFPLLVVA